MTFEEPICFECWGINKENFYEQVTAIIEGCLSMLKLSDSGFTTKRFDEMCEYIKMDNKIKVWRI